MGLLSIFVTLALAGTAPGQGVVYTNGNYNGQSAVSPLAWDPVGIIQDFSVDAAIFNRIRIEVVDTTTPIGIVSSIPAARIRIYNITGRRLEDLNYNVDVPVFDRTYTTAAGTLRKTLAGATLFGGDVEYFDLIGEGALGIVSFALFYNLPGQTSPPSNHYWLSATRINPFSQDARVFGPGVNAPIGGQDVEGAFTIFRDIPEAAGLGVFVAAVFTSNALGRRALRSRRGPLQHTV